jgi:hypothetical protein
MTLDLNEAVINYSQIYVRVRKTEKWLATVHSQFTTNIDIISKWMTKPI